ncbi:MAG: PD40 domain-containing protein [Verrucomicrobia bacterium]|nr:PD40 domain-containing protein [Verrucomicrobiota bacterium]
MADPARSPAARAVFLSYTTEDLAIALAVCEALREAGVEVWMDRSELQGGDAWDENIQRQIRECALIIPIISARTQARREGYFRLEWRLADERTRLVAEGTPLIVPVVADDTRQADALVPKSFLTVQWSRLPHGNVPPALALRVRKLLGLEAPGVAVTLPPVALPASPADTVPLEDEPTIGRPNEKTEAFAPTSPPLWSRPILVALVVACVALLAGVFVGRGLRPAPAPDAESKRVVRFVETLPPGVSFRRTGRSVLAISPDGRSFAYNTTGGLFIRKFSELSAHAIPGTELDLYNPVFSPDGQSVAYVAVGPGELQRISVIGGASVRLGPTGGGSQSSMSWESDDRILFGNNDGIWRAATVGNAKPEPVIPAASDERLSAPQLLPGGKHVLFSSNRPDGFQVEVRSLAGGERKVVVSGGRAACYLPATGHLLYMMESDLFGVAFDVERLVTVGNPVPLVQSVRVAGGSETAHYAVAGDGTLLYLPGGVEKRLPVLVDRAGAEQTLKLEPAQYNSVRFSPDGTKIVMDELSGGTRGFLVWNLAGETRTRLTQTGGPVGSIPLWTADSLQVIFGGPSGRLMVKPVNNTRPPEVFVNAPERDGQRNSAKTPLFFAPDGQKIFFSTAGRIGSIPIGAAEEPAWLNGSVPGNAVLSPDGKWLAYASTESGRTEVFVSPFPGVTDDRVPVSKEGGAQPLWSRDGKELFYVGGSANLFPAPLMAATVQVDGGKFTVVAQKPVWSSNPPYFTTTVQRIFRNYDISPDGQRFIVLKDVKPVGAAGALDQIFVVQNWTEELKRRVPRPGK